ncbi:MAG: class I SAM-dependent methyltransferase [Clostridiales bacterium]|nr:class I SAM-dependent methyltransferase [Clostridiales bacterium]
MYTAFARVYDRLMDQVDYAAWAGYYQQLMEGAGIGPGKRCVECACGTGSITIPLRRAGYQMTGVDLSQDMLALAMEKAGAAGVNIPFVCQDMTKLQVPRRVECVLATCDGVNYLTGPEKAQAFFAAAFQALRPGGILIFDVSTPEKLQNTLGNNTLFSDDEEIAFIWRNAYQERTGCVQMNLSIFERQADGRYQRFEESQMQRAHSREELTLWLQQAGFEGITFYGRQRMSAPRPGDDRWHILARKAE